MHNILERSLFHHARIRVHHGKTKMWNRSGRRPTGVDELTAVAQLEDPEAVVWRGDQYWVEVQDSAIWDGSSDGEPVVRPNNGRDVASRIGDAVRDRSTCGSEETANSVHSGTRQLSLMSGGVLVTQLDEASQREAPVDIFQFNLAQESDAASLVTVPEMGSMMILRRKTKSCQREECKSTVSKHRR